MSTTPQAPDQSLLDRYLAGEATPDECQAIHAWAESAGARAGLAALEHGVTDPLGPLTPRDVPLRVAAIVDYSVRAARRNRQRPASHGVSVPRMAATRPRRIVVGWTAALAGIAALLFFAIWRLDLARRAVERPSIAAEQVYRTKNGQRATITLADNSTVTLGPASTLSVAADFGQARRAVTVAGEAFFDVTQDAPRPFVVTTRGAEVRVLGTTFNVRRYPDDRGVRVAVATGKVSLRLLNATNRGEAILTAGTLGVASDSGKIGVSSPATVTDEMAWTTGRLVFRDKKMREAIAELERRYDITLHLQDSTMASQTLTAVFSDEPIGQVLDALALALRARYTRSGPNGRDVIFLPARDLIERAVPPRNTNPTTPRTRYGR